MKPISFGIIGGGWRAEYYLRIAQQLPHLFHIAGVYVRSPEKREAFKQKWNNVPLYHSVEEAVINNKQQFIVLSISKMNAARMLLELGRYPVPILAETPPAATIEQLNCLARELNSFKHIQIAEQYIYQPSQTAKLNIIDSGLIGDVNHVQVSLAHGYHAINLLRKWLNVQAEPCTITAIRHSAPVVEGPGRNYMPSEEKLVYSQHDLAIWQFAGGKSALYDFCREQYFSPLRQPRSLIRGTKGEIISNQISWTPSPGKYCSSSLTPKITGLSGQIEPLAVQGIQFEGNWLYENPFYPAALSDEEIAIAQVLLNMNDFVNSGTSFYSLQEALIDTYLSLKLEQALLSNQPVTADFNQDVY